MLETIIQNIESYYAHLPKNNEKKEETLKEHTDLAILYFEKFLKNGMKLSLNQILKGMSFRRRKNHVKINEKFDYFYLDMIKNVVCLHDLGKINPRFQWEKMNNSLYKDDSDSLKRVLNSNHSLFSSVFFLYYYLPKIDNTFEDKHDRSVAYRLVHDLAFLISKHHGYLNRMDETFFYSVREYHESIRDNAVFLKNIINKQDFQSFDFSLYEKKIRIALNWDTNENLDYFLFLKLVYGLLVTSDFYATYTYMSLNQNQYVEIEQFTQEQIESMVSKYQDSELFSHIQEGKGKKIHSDSAMNEVRTSLYWDVHNNYERNKNSLLYFLEAPTGAGKTNLSYSLGLRMLQEEKKKRLFYIFPFNTLMDQTKQSLEQHLTKESGVKLQILNSTVSAFDGRKEQSNVDVESTLNYKDYQRGLFKKQMLHFPFVLTSHVHFFDMLFGTSRESHLTLPHLMDAVIILDEIQSYTPKVWEYMIEFFMRYAQIFNWKVIVMSATLPPLELMLDSNQSECSNLLPNASDYYNHPCFKNRVEISTRYLTKDPLEKEELFVTLKGIVSNNLGKRILVEMISKKAAKEVFDYLNDEFDEEIYKLDGNDTKIYREKLLNYIKTEREDKKTIIIVSTQVIEAGVDIDMEVGIKDISLLDSEEQFMGRINRSFKMKEPGIVHFIHYTKTKNIYKGDARLSVTLEINREKAIEILKGKKYNDYYKYVFEDIYKNEEEFLNGINKCNYSQIKKLMNLIEQETIQVFVDYNSENLSGKEVWNKYIDILEHEKDHAVKMMKLEELKELMAPFLFNFNSYTWEKNIDTEKMQQEGSIFYIENGEKYMDYIEKIDAKTLNRERLVEDFGGK